MEKFKWIDFDPVADGKVKPKGVIPPDENCGGNSTHYCQTGEQCKYGSFLWCYALPKVIFCDNQNEQCM